METISQNLKEASIIVELSNVSTSKETIDIKAICTEIQKIIKLLKKSQNGYKNPGCRQKK